MATFRNLASLAVSHFLAFLSRQFTGKAVLIGVAVGFVVGAVVL